MAAAESVGQGIRRITAVLEALGRSPATGLRATDVATSTGLNKATVHRLLSGLCRVGLVEQDVELGRFFLGFQIFVLGSAALNRFGISEIARLRLHAIEAQSHDTAYLSLRAGNDAVVVERVEGTYPVRVLTRVGERMPLGVNGGGVALLAFMTDDEIQASLIANEARIASFGMDKAQVWELVASTRRHGYAFFDGRVVPELAALAVPVRGARGEIAAAMTIVAVRERLGPARRPELLSLLQTEARKLEADLLRLPQRLMGRGGARPAHGEQSRLEGSEPASPGERANRIGERRRSSAGRGGRSASDPIAKIRAFASQHHLDPGALSADQKRVILQELDADGDLQVRGAIGRVAEALGTTRSNIYYYLRTTSAD